MRKKRLRLLHKLLILSFLPVIFTIIIFGTLSYNIYKKNILEQSMTEFEGLVRFTIEDLKQESDYGLQSLGQALSHLIKNEHALHAYLIDTDQKIIHDGTKENNLEAVYFNDSDIINVSSSGKEIISMDKNKIRIIIPFVLYNETNLLFTEFSLDHLNNARINVLRAMIYLGFFITAFILFLNIYISRSISRPIRYLHDAAQMIKKGDYNIIRQRDLSGDEIGELATTFYEMVNEIKISKKDLEDSNNKLHEKLKELEKFHTLTVDREMKMIEMKKMIEMLRGKR